MTGKALGVKCIRIIREELGLTRYGLAKKAGTSETHIKYLETVAQPRWLDVLEALIDEWLKAGRTLDEFWKVVKRCR